MSLKLKPPLLISSIDAAIAVTGCAEVESNSESNVEANVEKSANNPHAKLNADASKTYTQADLVTFNKNERRASLLSKQ